MQRVLGIGGLVFRSREPRALSRWYERHLGLSAVSRRSRELWRQEAGPTLFVPFDAATDYFGYFDQRGQPFMLVFRVRNLDGLLRQLRAEGVRVDRRRTEEAIGRFAWAYDPEGNKIELWEPNPAFRLLRGGDAGSVEREGDDGAAPRARVELRREAFQPAAPA